jgi:hypothetical protein
MNRENKILLSLLPYDNEEFKLKMLQDGASFKEIMRALKYYRCDRIDERIDNINKYNTVFFNEREYPKFLGNLRIPPMRIQSTSGFPKDDEYKIGLVSSRITSFEGLKGLTDFILQSKRNNITLMSFGRSGNFFMEDKFKEIGASRYSILSYGISDCYFSSDDSILLSTYEPKEKSNKSMKYSMYEVFGIICNAVVLFEINGEFDINKVVNSTLDCGGNLYLNRCGMHCNKNYNKALKLLLEGAPLISNLCDIDDFTYDYLNHEVVYPSYLFRN